MFNHPLPKSINSKHVACLRELNSLYALAMESSATREYPSLIHTFFLTHTVGRVFLNLEDKALYDEMSRLQGLGSNTSTGVPYTEDEIMVIIRGGKQRGYIPGVGRYEYSKNHMKTIKNGQTRTRGTEEHKRSRGLKSQSQKVNQWSNLGQLKSNIQSQH
ncbi:hypothetical protein Tco_1010619 [Tanacetum coccineum]